MCQFVQLKNVSNERERYIAFLLPLLLLIQSMPADAFSVPRTIKHRESSRPPLDYDQEWLRSRCFLHWETRNRSRLRHIHCIRDRNFLVLEMRRSSTPGECDLCSNRIQHWTVLHNEAIGLRRTGFIRPYRWPVRARMMLVVECEWHRWATVDTIVRVDAVHCRTTKWSSGWKSNEHRERDSSHLQRFNNGRLLFCCRSQRQDLLFPMRLEIFFVEDFLEAKSFTLQAMQITVDLLDRDSRVKRVRRSISFHLLLLATQLAKDLQWTEESPSWTTFDLPGIEIDHLLMVTERGIYPFR